MEPIAALESTQSTILRPPRTEAYMNFPFNTKYRGSIRKSEACHFDVATREQAQTKVIRFIGHGQKAPTILSPAERVDNILKQYNKFSQRLLYNRGELNTRYYKGLKAEHKSQWEEVLIWSSARLPLSRTEALFFGISGTDLPLKTRIWDYGPWQTFCLRAINFLLFSEEVSS
jgi:hypothetical protein